MTDETDKPEVRPDMMMSEETRAAIAVCTQMLATAERDGVRVLFAPASLEIFQSLYDSDDYWSDDGWPAIRVLEDQVVARFAARERNLHTNWRTLYDAWKALLTEIHESKRAPAAA